MSTVAVLGGGAGGQAAAVELTQNGHDVHLWNRRETTIAAVRDSGVVRHKGVLGAGETPIARVTIDLAEALRGADAAMICLPGIGHRQIFEDLAALGTAAPLVLNPGHTGGALHAREIWRRAGSALPPVAEFSTLTYVARINDGAVDVTGRASTVKAAALPGGGAALSIAQQLYSSAVAVENVLVSSLSNVNLVLHPPGAILGLSWAEATHGGFTFYNEGMTPGVGRVLLGLDAERLAVAAAFGASLTPLIDEMLAVGTADPVAAANGDAVGAIRGGTANRSIKAPDSVSHRYYREDFPFAVLPFAELAAVAEVDVPITRALLAIAVAAVDPMLLQNGVTAEELGVQGMSACDLVQSVSRPIV